MRTKPEGCTHWSAGRICLICRVLRERAKRAVQLARDRRRRAEEERDAKFREIGLLAAARQRVLKAGGPRPVLGPARAKSSTIAHRLELVRQELDARLRRLG